MKPRAFALMLFLAPTAIVAQQTSAVRVADSLRTEFGSIAERWLAAYNGTDATRLEPLYTEDAQYISGHVPGLVARGRAEVIANFAKGMKSGGHLESLHVLSVSRSCELATVLCEYRANNSGQIVRGRTLLLMSMVWGEWRIYLHMTVV